MLNQKSLFITSVFLFIVTLLLYIFAPNVYSYQYCIILLMVFILMSLIIISQTTINNNYFTFNVLFLISFFFANFVYPVFIYPIDPFYYSVFKMEFNHDVITKATALSLVGLSSYNMGLSLILRRNYSLRLKKIYNIHTLQLLLSIIVLLLFIAILLFAGYDFLEGKFSSTSKIPPGLLAVFQVSAGLLMIFIGYSKIYKGTLVGFLRRFKLIFIIIFCFVVLFVFAGDRGPAIQLVLISIAIFSIFVKPIKKKTLIIVALLGMFALTFLSYARYQGNSNTRNAGMNVSEGLKHFKLKSFFDVGMDLIVTNRSLYAGYDYANREGYYYGKTMVHYLFSPFPMLPSLSAQLLFDSTPTQLSTAWIITKNARASYGLGTTIIVDQYMSFGVIGVVFFMFLLGLIVTKFQVKAVLSNDLISIIVYIFLISYSVYLPRTTIFEPLRFIIWAILIFKFLQGFKSLLIRFLSKNENNQV